MVGFDGVLGCFEMSADDAEGADWMLVIPHKIDGSLTRSLSRGRVLGFGRGWGWILEV